MAELVKDMERHDCHDCGVKVGEYHQSGCDTERCPKCGGQLISCGCFVICDEDEDDEYFDELEFDKYEKEKWTGIMYEEFHIYAEEHDLWTFWGPDYGQSGWVKCDRNHPGASHDLNTAGLLVMRNWKPKLK